MSFIRVKTISGAKYAYEVENYWTDKGSRQRTKQYLGRVYTPETKRDSTLTIPEESNLKAVAKILARNELSRHGFDQEGKHLVWKNVRIDLNRGTFMAGDKPAVIEMNEGFLCAQTYDWLRNFTPKSERFEKKLATTVLAAGIGMPPDLFIALFDAAKKKFKRNVEALQDND